MRTIVVGYDGSEDARHALNRAAELAAAFEATVIVVSVVPDIPPVFGGADPLLLPPAVGGPPPVEYHLAVQEGAGHAEQLLADARASLEARGVRASTVSRVGLPVAEIVAVADENAADLIVVGTHEPGFLERLIAGSVSEGVARKAHCDVLIVHPR